MWTIALAVVFFALAMTGLALGVIFRGKCIRGTCGGGNKVIGPDGKPIQCETCPNKEEEHPV
jgi:hypothetical protein